MTDHLHSQIEYERKKAQLRWIDCAQYFFVLAAIFIVPMSVIGYFGG